MCYKIVKILKLHDRVTQMFEKGNESSCSASVKADVVYRNGKGTAPRLALMKF
jgi:hypothetical protein